MATLRDLVVALDTFIESASGLNINCIRGYPDFRRDNITVPLAALFYAGSSEVAAAGLPARVGGASKVVALTLGVYASDEINLLTLAQQLQLLRKGPTDLTGNGQAFKVYFGDDEREPPDDEAAKEVRHFITCPVLLLYEEAS